MATHRLDDKQPHAFWDNSYPARIRIKSGDTVVFETLEASANQVTPTSTSEAVRNLSFDPIHPLTGPVYIEGAEPGDGLEVEIISIKNKGWGWNAVLANFGLLAEDFPTPYLHHYKLDSKYCYFRDDIVIPYEPFCGVMGVGPRENGRLNTIPPRENGGNIDIRHLTPGTKVVFPVLIPGALFSCGDCHSAQGDGELNGTGIETPMTVTLRFKLLKSANIPELRFTTPASKKLTVTDTEGYFVTTAHGPDLFTNAQKAARYMIDHLTDTYDMTREQAYCLCGAAVDLKISEIVDAPNFIVSAYLPLSIFVKPKARASRALKRRPAKAKLKLKSNTKSKKMKAKR